MLDIDKIDEMEKMSSEDIEPSDSENEILSENSEEFVPKIPIKKKQNEKNEKNQNFPLGENAEEIPNEELSLNKSGEDFYNDKEGGVENNVIENNEIYQSEAESNNSEKQNKFKIKAKPKEKQKKIRYRKQFIDYEEDEDFIKKKKKIKETLYGNKKQLVNKKRNVEKPKEIITAAITTDITDNINNVNLEAEQNALEDDANYNNIIKIETETSNNNIDNYLLSQNTTKAVYNPSAPLKLSTTERKLTRNALSANKKLEEKNVVISDFNIIIKKSILDLEKSDISKFDFSNINNNYINPEIIFCDQNKIILNKSILEDSSLIENNNILKAKKEIIPKKQSFGKSTKNLKNAKANNLTKLNTNNSNLNFNKKNSRKFSEHKFLEPEIAANNAKGLESSLQSQEKTSEVDKYEEFDVEKENQEENPNDENYNENDEYSEPDLMKYNDKNFRRKQKVFDEDFVTGNQTKKSANANKSNQNAQQAPVRLSYQEKLSQKDLLYEAIFTELYNIKSLEDMQRLEELNKRDVNYSNKKQFSEFIKTVRRVVKKPENLEENANNNKNNVDSENLVLEKINEKEKRKISKEIININTTVDTSENNQNGELNVDSKMQIDEELKDKNAVDQFENRDDLDIKIEVVVEKDNIEAVEDKKIEVDEIDKQNDIDKLIEQKLLEKQDSGIYFYF